MGMSQRDAVYQAISSVVTFEDGHNIKEMMTPELRAQVNLILFEGFRSGAINLTQEYTDAELRSYVSGLQSNWIRKDPRMNGGGKYVAANPGSRMGQGDASLKAAKNLLASITPDNDNYEAVVTYIAERTAELAKVKTIAVDFSALPEHLRLKFNK